MTATLVTVGAEIGERTLWNPTILGVLVFASGIILFCGSVYLLLATNMGARLGFLVAFAGFTGLMVLLSAIWLSTATPLNVPRGRPASWQPVEVVDRPASSSIEQVRRIEQEGRPVDEEDFGEIRPAVDAALVIGAGEDEQGEPVEPSPFAVASRSRDVIMLNAWRIGGGTHWVLWHEALYEAVEFCLNDPRNLPPPGSLEVEPDPTCDPRLEPQTIVFVRDLGSIRQPPAMYLLAFSTLFALSLLALHWREKDERAAARREEVEAR